MTYLAYDPDRLHHFARRLGAAVDQLRALHCDDPEAGPATRTVRGVVRGLEDGVLPAVQRVLDAAPLRAPVRDRLDLPALQQSLARSMAVERGWAVLADPIADDPTRITAEEVDALARRLDELSPADVLDDPAASDWLVQELATIAQDAELSRRFATEFRSWATWGDTLALRREPRAERPGSEMDPEIRRLDQVVRAFARIASRGLDLPSLHATDAVALPWLDSMRPYAAALFVRFLELPPALLADAALRVVRRAPDPLDGRGPSTVDMVLRTMLAHDDALPRFAMGAVWCRDQLWAPVNDPDLPGEVLLRATDPSLVDAGTAGAIILPLLGQVADGGITQLTGRVLAGLVAPWTMQFTPASHDWPLSSPTRGALLAAALATDDALEAFIRQSDTILAGAQRSLAADPAQSVAGYLGYLGAIGALMISERIRRLDLREKAWTTVCNLAGLATSLIPWTVIGVAASFAVLVVHENLKPEPPRATHGAQWMSDAALTTAAAIAVRAVYDSHVAAGDLAASMPPPPEVHTNGPELPSADYLQHFLDWEEGLPGGDRGPIAQEVRLTFYTFLSPAQIGEHVAAQALCNSTC